MATAGFLDEISLYVQGGGGGNGASSFRREKFVPRGGPDGGDGGRGGGVFLLAKRRLSSFQDLQNRRHFRAQSGGPGGGSRRHGKRGEDLLVHVPIGTRVSVDEALVVDLTRDGEMAMVAKGGRGGLGNVHFATPTNRAPRMAEKGEPGESAWLQLELKTLADVGLVGLPNAGKSSLLAAMTAAHPKIGDYPFTTLYPNLGVASVEEETWVIADLPGLVEGAHKGVGLGARFLRHVERARLLLHVVDASAPEPLGSYHQVREELGAYSLELLSKPHLVATSKMDLAQAQQQWPSVAQSFAEMGVEAHAVSAVSRQGVEELVRRLSALSAEARGHQRAAGVASPTIRVYRLGPEAKTWRVERRGQQFHVIGRPVERWAAMTPADNAEAMQRLQRRLERLGVADALECAGARPGDNVVVGAIEFEWV